MYQHVVIASAFGDAATKIIAFLVEVRPALLAAIIFGAAVGVVDDGSGHSTLRRADARA